MRKEETDRLADKKRRTFRFPDVRTEWIYIIGIEIPHAKSEDLNILWKEEKAGHSNSCMCD